MPESFTGSNDLYLTDVSARDKPWDGHRSAAQSVQKLYSDSEFQRYAERIGDCSRLLGFSFEAQDSGELKLKLQQARFCRVRHCPVCQWRRSLMWSARFLAAAPKVQEGYPTARWVFLTLTVKNCPLEQLRETVQHLNKSWDRLSRRKSFPALGFVKSVEVTRAKDGAAHPHLHCLLLVPSSYFSTKYLSHAQWQALWQQSLQVDYLPSVHIRAVKGKQGEDQGVGLKRALLETLKYSVKEADLLHDSSWLHELTRQLHKTRSVSVGGVLKKFLSDEEPDDLIHPESDDLQLTLEAGVWFGWRKTVNRYAKVDP